MDKVLSLTEELLDNHPVWEWNAGHDHLQPLVLDGQVLPEDHGELHVKAACRTCCGLAVNGYVIALGEPHVVGLFVAGDEFIFNKGLPGMVAQEAKKLFVKLNVKPSSLFPLEYDTNFAWGDGTPLKGSFEERGYDVDSLPRTPTE